MEIVPLQIIWQRNGAFLFYKHREYFIGRYLSLQRATTKYGINIHPSTGNTELKLTAMADLDSILRDNHRWQDSVSEVRPSTWVCLFEIAHRMNYAWEPVRPGSILWRFSPSSAFYAYDTLTNQLRRFDLDFRLCQQIAFLDLEYWTNVTFGESCIARYLQLLRDDLLEELQTMEHSATPWQPRSTRPWAVRTMHSFGHSHFDRTAYLRRCRENGWQNYMHDEPLIYRMRSIF
jgi:hypothetical protein